MVRNFVALALLAAALTLLPDTSTAGPAGFRGGGGGVRIGGFRPIPQFRVRQGAIRGPHLVSPRVGPSLAPGAGPVRAATPAFKPVTIPPVAKGAFTYGSRLVRLNHGRHRKGGLILPVTGDGYFGYVGAPYDPSEAIPVYGPQPAIQHIDDLPPDAPRMAPLLTRARGENQDAWSAEKVTVPATEGEREITVVRC